jgi:hypothetical protein
MKGITSIDEFNLELKNIITSFKDKSDERLKKFYEADSKLKIESFILNMKEQYDMHYKDLELKCKLAEEFYIFMNKIRIY